MKFDKTKNFSIILCLVYTSIFLNKNYFFSRLTSHKINFDDFIINGFTISILYGDPVYHENEGCVHEIYWSINLILFIVFFSITATWITPSSTYFYYNYHYYHYYIFNTQHYRYCHYPLLFSQIRWMEIKYENK